MIYWRIDDDEIKRRKRTKRGGRNGREEGKRGVL